MNALELKEGLLFKIRNSRIVRTLMYPYMNYKRRAGKKKYSKEAVRSKFLKITSEQIEKVFDQIDHTTKRVHNPKAYVLTLLYNADIIDSFIAKRESDTVEDKQSIS